MSRFRIFRFGSSSIYLLGDHHDCCPNSPVFFVGWRRLYPSLLG
jgi:hypothetical protein